MREEKEGRESVGWATSRPRLDSRRGKGLGRPRVGLERSKKIFFKRKSFPISGFQIQAKIQMKFEFHLKQPSPRLNQK